MQINLSGQHVNVTPALNDYVNNKLGRLARRFDSVTTVNVVLKVEKLLHRADATMRVAGGELHAYATHEDMYAAIDALGDKLDRQVMRFKEKVTNHHRADGGIKTQVD